MKKLWDLLHNHITDDFSWPYYLSIALFLAGSIALNVFLDFEFLIDQYNGSFMRLVGYFLLYGFAYYGGFGLTFLFNKKVRPLATPKFWLFSLFGLTILTLDSGFPYFNELMDWAHIDMRTYAWSYLVINDSIGFLFVTLPLFLIYPFLPKSNGEGYGLLTTRYNPKPYFLLLLLMVPLIAAASFTTGFIKP